MKFTPTNTITFLLSIFFILSSCNEKKVEQNHSKTLPKLSLAQWSYHKELFSGKMNNQDFIKKAAELGFEGVEYVNQFFKNKVENLQFLDSLNKTAKEVGIKNLLIMVDGEGMLGASNPLSRDTALTQHKKWVDAAKILGCSAIRINAHGEGDSMIMMQNCAESISKLATYGNSKGVKIIIENHGSWSNNGAWLKGLLELLKPYSVGSLPDFDNWCTMREKGLMYGSPCIKYYDRFKGLEELMPYASSLSVKSFNFDKDGMETTIDYPKMFDIIKKYNYDGYLGIEFEGDSLPADIGVVKTKDLAVKCWNQ
ncbi:MAG: hypothetical protein RLZZ546_1752 [Bacteroidota bacterium]|jgi:sugar phosphate isomerase/epimerase